MKGVWLLSGGVNGLFAVMAGAFAAHGLESSVSESALAAFKTGADYHMYHALALMTLGVITPSDRNRSHQNAAAIFFWAGIILFSGSLYFLGFTESRSLVMVTPIGGLSFLVGWLLITLIGWREWRAR